jgi:uncharacterized protein (DUF1697 family)
LPAVARYVAFLRGINLGNRRVKNDELRGCFTTMGLERAETFRASGNVVFDTDRPSGSLAGEIETGLREQLGYEVQTFLRDAEEIAAIAAHEPFAALTLDAREGKLQVMLLRTAPTAAARSKVLALASEEDLLAIAERECYWLPSGRMTDSALDLKTIAKALGEATQRTKATIELIAAKHFT